MNDIKTCLQHFAAGTNIQGTAGVSNNATGTVTPYAEGEGLSAEERQNSFHQMMEIALEIAENE